MKYKISYKIYMILGALSSISQHWFMQWFGVGQATIHFPNHKSWWRHQMETFSALLAICAANSPVTGEFPAQRPVTRGFVIFFDLRLNKRLSKQPWGWWFEMPSRPLWRHCNDNGPVHWHIYVSQGPKWVHSIWFWGIFSLILIISLTVHIYTPLFQPCKISPI